MFMRCGETKLKSFILSKDVQEMCKEYSMDILTMSVFVHANIANMFL